MNAATWFLIIHVVSGGAMGGTIAYRAIPMQTQSECVASIKTVRVEQSSMQANGENTHTVLVYCVPGGSEK